MFFVLRSIYLPHVDEFFGFCIIFIRLFPVLKQMEKEGDVILF